MTEAIITEVVAALTDPTRHVGLERITEAPRAPGIYAWWSPSPSLLGIAGTPYGATYLYYVGITKTKRDLRHRLANHSTGKARGSTLRLVLAGLGAVPAEPIASGTGKVRLPGDSEAALTAWIAANLRVSWCEVADPGAIEAAIVAALRPPLNLEHNTSHAMYAHVKASRAAFRARAFPHAVEG